MAGDWIKMRTDLASSPKVVRMASALRADRHRIVGGLHAAWSLFDAHSTDGCLVGYSPDVLDELIGWPGFATAMIAVNWLEDAGVSGLFMPDFETHNGQPAKRRAQEADRKRTERRNASASNADNKRTREEKRREEESSNHTAGNQDAALEGGTGMAVPNPAAGLAIALNRAGFRCTSSNPNLVAAANEGVTVEHILEVASLDACAGKGAGYVIAIARREMTEGPNDIGKGVKHEAPKPGTGRCGAADQVAAAILARNGGAASD